MKKILLAAFLLLLTFISYSQTVPVTLHFKPEYTQFTTLRVAGTFNGWNNADPNMVMTDVDGDGEYSITIDLASGIDHNYKFVMDADWGLAFTDPDNTRINLTDSNNSMLLVKDPMITYLLPRGINSRSEEYIDATVNGLPIRAVFAFTAANPINPDQLVVTIDGINLENPAQYYNAATKEFLYQPNPALSTGEHTVTVIVNSTVGSDVVTSKFIRDPNYVAYQIPVDFYYDQYNTKVEFNQTLSQVALVGGFNNWNDSFNPLNDNDGDGLWQTTATMLPGTYEYKFKLNKLLWANDPDEPKVGESADKNSLVIVSPDSTPTIKLIQPLEGTVYNQSPQTFNFNALIRPGIKSAGLDETSIQVKVDGLIVTHSIDTTNTLSFNAEIKDEGRHTVEVYAKNLEGYETREIYSYGIKLTDKGKYFVDAVDDEIYSYPNGIADGSLDILSLSINETATHDSLKFVIDFRDIDERTRLGMIICNTSTSTIDDPKGLNIKTLNWKGQGVYFTIAPPNNSFENKNVENKIMINNNPVIYSYYTIKVNEDAVTANRFEFVLSLAYLDSIIGSWTKDRLFYAYSFIAAEDKSGNSYEVTAADGGSDAEEDPDIYDAAFTRSSFWQNRLLSNYLISGQIDGPATVALDGKGRGIAYITAVEISDSLAKFGPEITFLTPGVEYWYPNVTVYGTLSDSTITTITFNMNGLESFRPVTNGQFAIPVTLKEGENIIFVKAEDSRGYKSTSKNLVLTYESNNQPIVKIIAEVAGRQVTLTADAVSPVGAAMTYLWSTDASNPASIFLSATTKSVTINIPLVDGEYYFNVRVRDTKNNRVYAKTMLISQGDSLIIPGINSHSAWIDDAIVYEIYPRSFSQTIGFNGVTEKIPYLKELGINTIWFMPIYTGPTTHGYEITDYYGLEEDYGTETDFKNMLAQLKANGIRVILDYVVNHTSVQHPFMQNIFDYKLYSPYSDFYIWSGEPGNSAYEFLFDWSSLPNLNHNNEYVRKYFIDVAKYWIQTYGIDGYRCDVAWGVEERNQQFWQEWREALKSIKPEVFLEAEASSSTAEFYNKRFDSANDWDLRTKILGVLSQTATIESLHQEVTRSYAEHARPFRFVENHDENRVAQTFDTKRSLLVHTLLFTLNGIPLIYSGGEVGEVTRREMIDWTDADNLTPSFKKLIQLRKSYIHNPVVSRIINSDNSNVYSFSSISENDVVITAANFRQELKNITLNLSALPFDGTSNYYLTDLMDGTVYTISPLQRDSYPVTIDGYQAKVFYYGLDSVSVGVNEPIISNLPGEYKLLQNYPNPFNPVTRIKYQIKENEKVTLKIYDMLGREVITLVDAMQNKGNHEVSFNASNLSSGIYFYQLNTANYSDVKKLILLK